MANLFVFFRLVFVASGQGFGWRVSTEAVERDRILTLLTFPWARTRPTVPGPGSWVWLYNGLSHGVRP